MGEAEAAFVALIERFPGLLPFFEWLGVAKKLWHSFEGVALLLGLFWIMSRLRAERLKMNGIVRTLGELDEKLEDHLATLADKVDTAVQMAKAARETAETFQTSSASTLGATGNLAHWEQLRANWQEMRDRIELKIDSIARKQTRAKYAKISRYSYRDIIISLCEDDLISSTVESALLNMNSIFMGRKARPSQVTAADVAQFDQFMVQVNGALPPIPRHELNVPPLPALQAAE